MAKTSVELVDLKQKNSELTMDLDKLSKNKEALESDIKFKNDMVNNLSLELARTKGDKKLIMDRVVQLNQENDNIRQEVKNLTQTKASLQKSPGIMISSMIYKASVFIVFGKTILFQNSNFSLKLAF